MDLHLDLADAAGASLRVRLETAVRDRIRDGVLAPRTRLPATRVLAAQLGVSRGVVVDAYAQLVAEGYLNARRGAGTIVASTLAREDARLAAAPSALRATYELSPFVPALDGFPRAAWRAAVGRALRDAPDERLGLPDAAGVPELRSVLATYLARARGVRTRPDRIVVCNGLRQGLTLLWPALRAGGVRCLGIESPGWSGVSQTAADAGLATRRLALDERGLIVEAIAGHADIAAVAVAPAHQYPTGAVLAPERRAALVGWARTRGGIVVEDDYDAEYRYDREPIGSLQGLAPDVVVYGGSTSKSLAPALRLGWLVLPERLVAPVTALQRVRGSMPAALGQLVLADLIERGELDRHLRRQRARYRRRRDALLAALAERLPEAVVQGAAAGLFVVVRLPAGSDEAALTAAARGAGLAVEAVDDGVPGLVVGYANLAEAAIAAVVDRLARVVRDA